MGNGNQKDKENSKEKKHREQTSEVPLPYCTNAPDPEHARASNEDEPCDDARSGGSNAVNKGDEITETEESSQKDP